MELNFTKYKEYLIYNQKGHTRCHILSAYCIFLFKMFGSPISKQLFEGKDSLDLQVKLDSKNEFDIYSALFHINIQPETKFLHSYKKMYIDIKVEIFHKLASL